MFRHLFRGCAAVLFCLSIVAGAEAAKPTMPLSVEWAVGPIHAEGAGGARYCSMKNSYPAGQTLVFARDVKEEAFSIAVDFKKDIFEAGKTYPTDIAVGDVKRGVTATASTAQVAVMEMGWDEDFEDAIGKKSALTVSLEGKTVSFGLKGSSKALARLKDCGSDQFELKTVQQDVPPPSPPALETARGDVLSDAVAQHMPKDRVIVSAPSMLRDLLAGSGIVKGKMKVGTGAFPTARTYYWATEDVYGAAQELSNNPEPDFALLSQGYLQQAAQLCGGEFKQAVEPVQHAGEMTMQLAKMSCLNPKNNAVGVVLFVADRQSMGVITLEGLPAQIPTMLQQREAVVTGILKLQK